MLDLNFDYRSCVSNSEKVAWKLDEILPEGTNLDFGRRFLPDALVGASKLAVLDDKQKLALNQITGNSYLNLFQFVEEYILVSVVQHAQAEMFGDHDAIRALVRFADEEVKHQQLFKRYRVAFDRGVGKPCPVLECAAEVAGVILSKSPMAVMLTTCHIELMTLQHYTECVKEDEGVDPLFAKLLKSHWLEESQHAKIDALELDKVAHSATPEMITQAFDEYLGILEAFDGLLAQQAEMDVAALASVTGATFDADESAVIKRSQHQGYRKTFLWYGMTNPTFINYIHKMSPEGADRVAARATELVAS
jgi:hypothetical protein